jgi:hypothetical protein
MKNPTRQEAVEALTIILLLIKDNEEYYQAFMKGNGAVIMGIMIPMTEGLKKLADNPPLSRQ